MTRRRHLLPFAVVLGAGLVLATPGTASAHIEPDFAAVPADAAATITFTLEHGCDGSPTTTLELQMPDSVTDAQAVEKEGWTGSTADGVVTFAGGPQAADEETTFGITFTAPAEGTELRFPIVQTCEEGEIDWIDTSEDDEHPAPVVMVGPAGAPPTTAAAEEEEGGGDETTIATTATTGSDSEPGDSPSTSTDDDSNAPLVIGGLIALVVVGGGAAVIRSRRAS